VEEIPALAYQVLLLSRKVLIESTTSFSNIKAGTQAHGGARNYADAE
jgi:hypothetical protein